jgi:uncharacterized protein with LGFP repeats
MNTFQGGAIYWSPSTGAHVVYGAIGAKYNSLGGPASSLGRPTSDEAGIPGGRVSYFQHGKIVWTPGGGAYVVYAVTQMTMDTGYITFDNGVPVGGWANLAVYADGSYHFTGSFHDSGATSYNDSLVVGLVSTSSVLYTFTHTGHVRERLARRQLGRLGSETLPNGAIRAMGPLPVKKSPPSDLAESPR